MSEGCHGPDERSSKQDFRSIFLYNKDGNEGKGRLLEKRRLKGLCSSCSEEKSPMVPNPDPKQDN